MTPRAALLLVLCLCTPITAAVAEFHNSDESISGWGFRAIQVASQEFERNKLDVTGYQILVRQRGASVFVTFGDPDADPLQVGSTEKMPRFTVELRKSDLTLVRSYFVR